jgi:hypothetical protein
MVAETFSGALLVAEAAASLALLASCYAYAMRLSGRRADSLWEGGHLDSEWDGLLEARRGLGLLALFCVVTLVIGDAALLRIDRSLLGVAAALVAPGLAPTAVYFGYIHGANYVLDHPEDRGIFEQQSAARAARRSRSRSA